MNRALLALQAVNRDLERAKILARSTNYRQLTDAGASLLLNRFYSTKKRALRCRHVTGTRMRRLRATILRRSFQYWRTVVRKLAQTPGLRNWAGAHLLSLSEREQLFDPNNWVVRLLGTDPDLFRGVITAINNNAPLSTGLHDPYWRCLKLTLSITRL